MNGQARIKIPALATDRRSDVRQKAYLTGILIYGPGGLTLDGVVRDLTATGTHLRLATTEFLKPPYVLLICRSGEAFEAEIAWKTKQEVGLIFTSNCNLEKPVTEVEKIARRLWIENQPRTGSWP